MHGVVFLCTAHGSRHFVCGFFSCRAHLHCSPLNAHACSDFDSSLIGVWHWIVHVNTVNCTVTSMGLCNLAFLTTIVC